MLKFREVAVVHLGVRMKAYTVPVLHEDVQIVAFVDSVIDCNKSSA